MARLKDVFPGAEFGMLKVVSVERVASTPAMQARGSKTYAEAVCQCQCGRTWTGHVGRLGTMTNSCGCLLAKKLTTHGRSRRGNTRLYDIWYGMLNRCTNEKHRAYKNYGGRGITVCPEWLNSVDSFCAWAETSGYADGLTLDREKNNEGYSPSNCRWITRGQQNSNRRDNVYISAWGESKLMSEWMKDSRVVVTDKTTVRYRIKKMKWSPEQAFSTPTRKAN